jgi:hypothetical protein
LVRRLEDNGSVTVRNVTEARGAIASGRLELISGTRECSWLDVKKEHYKLGHPASNVELLKDVTAFANASGGLLIVGFETRLEDGREVVGAITPVSTTAVSAEQYRKILRTQVFPMIRELSVEWAALDGGAGVLVVDIPRQPDADKPFLIPGRTDREGFSLPIRDGDGTLWLPLQNVQRLLSIGWNAKDGMDRQEILRLFHQATQAASTPSEPVIRVGQGAPEARRAFEQAWESAGGEPVLGTPIEPVQSIDGGYVQHFSSGGVICSIIGQPAIAVSEEVWSAIATIGSRAGQYGPAVLGLPDVSAMSALPDLSGELTILNDQRPEILLKNGSWGPARLIKKAGFAEWVWEPLPVIDQLVLSNRWSALEPVDFRVRAIATLPLLLRDLPDRARIDPPRRTRLETILRSGKLGNFMSLLCLRRGKPMTATSWHWPREELIYQTDHHGECRSSLTLPDGTRALETAVLIQRATGNQVPSLMTGVELRIFQGPMRELFARSTNAAGQQDLDLRLSVPELIEFFLAAWPTATLDAPWAALPIDVHEVSLIGPPRVEFQFEASPSGVGDRLSMEDVLDMSVYGERSRSIPGMGAFGITAPFDLADGERRRLLVRGLTELAQAWGCMEANEANV